MLREKNVELQGTLATEIRKLRKLSDYLAAGKLEGGFIANLKEILSFIPMLRPLTRRSIEELPGALPAASCCASSTRSRGDPVGRRRDRARRAFARGVRGARTRRR